MKEVDIEGFKITVKNMTMLTQSTTVKSELQMYQNKNYYKFKYPYTHSKVKNFISICIKMKLTVNSIQYPIHIFRSKRLILKVNYWLSRT